MSQQCVVKVSGSCTSLASAGGKCTSVGGLLVLNR
jgi:hypothetical protein